MNSNWKTEYTVGGATYQVNVELAGLFPRMNEAAFALFKRDISINGLTDSELLSDSNGNIIDGWHRLRAAEELDLSVTVYCISDDLPTLIDENDTDTINKCIAQYLVSKNLHRRHLTADQKAEIYEKAGITASGQGKRSDLTSEHVPKLSDSDKKTIRNRAQLKKEAPELLTKVDDGEISSRKAVEIHRNKSKQVEPPSSKEPERTNTESPNRKQSTAAILQLEAMSIEGRRHAATGGEHGDPYLHHFELRTGFCLALHHDGMRKAKIAEYLGITGSDVTAALSCEPPSDWIDTRMVSRSEVKDDIAHFKRWNIIKAHWLAFALLHDSRPELAQELHEKGGTLWNVHTGIYAEKDPPDIPDTKSTPLDQHDIKPDAADNNAYGIELDGAFYTGDDQIPPNDPFSMHWSLVLSSASHEGLSVTPYYSKNAFQEAKSQFEVKS